MLLPQLLLFWDYKGAPPRSEKSYLVYNENKIMTVPTAGKTFPEPEKSGWCPEANKSGAPTGRRPVVPQIPCTKQNTLFPASFQALKQNGMFSLPPRGFQSNGMKVSIVPEWESIGKGLTLPPRQE